MSMSFYLTNPTTNTNEVFNLSNRNSYHLLQAMGVAGNPWDHPGLSLEAAQAAVFSALQGDEEQTPAAYIPTYQVGNFINCGRREGYLQEKLTILLDAILKAQESPNRQHTMLVWA